MNKKIVIANWKLNGDQTFVKDFIKKINSTQKKIFENIQIILSPPIIYINYMFKKINNKKIFFASQNVDYHDKGAFTGEISPYMINEIGAKYVILGHSERRKNHFENNTLIAKKFFSIKKNNLIPILCIGETKKEKEKGLTKEVLINQINQIFLTCGNDAFNKTFIAYEPIWAIGTGKNESPNNINKIMKFIKNYIMQKSLNKNIKFKLQYGGSVSDNNVHKIIEEKYIDGVLVGSASLNYKIFLKILKKISFREKK
ncbi:triose-phosphate isomerase [Buchnera aphidicola]|uniref:triose-phosphate isomerase n=1 Tax=Buchnera aphidicola TaxID=9 RepID=UPI0020938FAE|nr:triose-phosphate isomerase [Buchnera aphidicola]USS94330.1 triose-phosphate isomerase [Buchnera aphidicola (Sipha maydis)]WII23489.1 triose-phosphate isomerase [Buchnera aphidicola (Sipha maydis)]